MIRIIAGLYRSRQLTLPPLSAVRPTQDRIRESVFSSLGPAVSGAKVLDLFAGSGAYGFESLSRGAASAVFSDKEGRCLRAVADSAARLGCAGRIQMLNMPYQRALAVLAAQKKRFSLVFLDPPYALDVNRDIIVKADELGLLDSESVIVAEQESSPEEIEGFSLRKHKYSYKQIGIYRKDS